MTITIYIDNSIAIDGVKTGLKVTQTGQRTIVYIPEHPIDWQGEVKGDLITLKPKQYREIQMPHPRYSLVHDTPASGAAGKIQFETDIRALLPTLDSMKTVDDHSYSER